MQIDQAINSGNPNILKPRKALNKAFAQFKGTYINDFPITINHSFNFSAVIKRRIEIEKNFTGSINKFLQFISSNYKLESNSRKFQSWHELDFDDFIKELNKAIKVSNKARAKEAAVEAGEGGVATKAVEVPHAYQKR